MLLGIGIDQTTVSRLRESAKKHGVKLLNRLFTEKEKKHCETKRDPWPHYAARFAAKEALIKAWGEAISPLEMEVVTNTKGRPSLTLKGKTLKLAKKKKVRHLHLSLSHEGDSALAIVILEG